MKSFEDSFCNLNFSPSTSTLLNFFFPFIDIRCFFGQVLQYSCTIVLLNQKRRWSCDFPPRKTPVAQKHRAISCQENMTFCTPPSGFLGTPLLLPQSLCGRMDVRTYGRSREISRIDRLPNLLSNGAPLVGFARRIRSKNHKLFSSCSESLNYYYDFTKKIRITKLVFRI